MYCSVGALSVETSLCAWRSTLGACAKQGLSNQAHLSVVHTVLQEKDFGLDPCSSASLGPETCISGWQRSPDVERGEAEVVAKSCDDNTGVRGLIKKVYLL